MHKSSLWLVRRDRQCILVALCYDDFNDVGVVKPFPKLPRSELYYYQTAMIPSCQLDIYPIPIQDHLAASMPCYVRVDLTSLITVPLMCITKHLFQSILTPFFSFPDAPLLLFFLCHLCPAFFLILLVYCRGGWHWSYCGFVLPPTQGA